MKKIELEGKTKNKTTRGKAETEDHEKQRLVTLKRLKRGDEIKLERKLRLEMVVTSKQLRLAVATKRLRLAMETDEESKARLEKMVATTQLTLALETEDERRAKKGMDFDLDLVGIEIGVFKNKKIKERFRLPCNGNHFFSY